MKRFNKILVLLAFALVGRYARSQEVSELVWKTKTTALYDNACTLYNEIKIKEQFFSTYCSIVRTDDGSFSGSLSFSLPSFRAGALAYTSIAYLLFNPATSTAIQYQSPQSAFSAALTSTIKGYALGHNAGFFSLYSSQDTLSTPWTSGLWIQTPCTNSVVLRFLTAYGNKQAPDTNSWTYSSTVPSVWSVLGLISQGSAINCALIYGLRRGIDNSFGWFIRAYSIINFTIATITADTAFSNGAYYTPNLTDFSIIALFLKTVLFPKSIVSGTVWLNHTQKSLFDAPEQTYGGSLDCNSFALKGKLSLELAESQTTHVVNLISSLEFRPTVFQKQSKTIGQSKQLLISLATNWKTIDAQADMFSITGLLEYKQFITLSIKIKHLWDTHGCMLYFNPGISIPFIAGSMSGYCQFSQAPEAGIPELQKLELVLVLHN